MAISEIGASGGASSATSQQGLAQLSSEDFFKLLVTEMQNQDPFEPSSTSDIIGQVSQIRTIEQNGKLTETLDAMTNQQRMGGASELIGKFVQAVTVDADGEPRLHEGVVTAVRFLSDGSAVLELDNGDAVSADTVARVTNLSDMTNSSPDGEESDGEAADGDENADGDGDGDGDDAVTT